MINADTTDHARAADMLFSTAVPHGQDLIRQVMLC